MTAPIGIFDSGIGGLTVARSVRTALPHESIVYLGDTARVPYGPKSPDVVRRYAVEIVGWLLQQSVKAIVVACNTATAHALDLLVERTPVPIIGVIKPGARAAARASSTRSGRVGVIGTAGTIASGAYRRALLHEDPALEVTEQACPLFVPLVEEGWANHPVTRTIAQEYLAPLHARHVDTVVLGCTHYPMLRDVIADVMGPEVQLIDSGEETARELMQVLAASALAAPPTAAVADRWTATDDVGRFARVGTVFMGEFGSPVEIVELPGDARSTERAQFHA